MSMKRVLFLSLLFLFITGIWIACKRNDTEPDYPVSPISRLYVSFSDIANSDTRVYENIIVFDPADSASQFIPDPNMALNSSPKTGMGITFSPDLPQGFQVSRDDTTIKYFSVNDAGSLSNASRSFKDTITLYSPRSIRYDSKSDQLFITNDLANNPSLSIYYNPIRLAGQQAPRKRIQLDRQPWGIAMGMQIEQDSVILVTMQGDAKQLWGFKMHGIATGEQFVKGAPDYKLTINGADDLRGIAYSPQLDLLVVSDLGAAQINQGSDHSKDGKIYIIENAKQAITAGGSITPTRIITGATTTLVDPIDVAIAGLPNRNQFIYVADREKHILRFDIDANGDKAPNSSYNTAPLTPEFIYLDARGGVISSSENGQ